MYTLVHDFDCAFTIFRGRFDDGAARLRCRIEGEKRSLDRALGYLASLGAGVRLAPPARESTPRAGSAKPPARPGVQSVRRSPRAAR